MNRFNRALDAVNQGEINPSWLARNLIEACQEIREAGHDGTLYICADPAVRILTHRLATVTNVPIGADFPYDSLLSECAQFADQ